MRAMMNYRPALLLVLLAAAIAFPFVFSNPAQTSIAVETVMYAAMATAWNIFAGYTGYIALGHAAFFGTGAYALALICKHWHITSDFGPLMLIPVCGLIAAAVSVPLGAIALRTRSHTFIVITIAIFFIAQLLAYDLRQFTNGSAGLELPIPSWGPDVYNVAFYYGGLIILLLALAISWWVRSSKYGLGLLAIRDDEDRALGLGVKTGPSKLLAFVISAFFVGMVGALWADYIESVFPNSGFDALIDVAIALMVFMGVIGTLAGPILGALILVPAKNYIITDSTLTAWYLVLYGALFLLIILLLPEGILPTARKRWTSWSARQRAPASAGDGSPPPEQPQPVAAASGDGGDQ